MQNLCRVRGQITRRVLLGQLACFAGLAQTPPLPGQSQPSAVPPSPPLPDDPLRLLRPEHPRLLLLDSDLDRIRQAVRENLLARRIYGDLEKECDRLLSIPPVEYKLAGPRLQAQTHRALDRITTLSLMYRLAKRDPWLRRAIMELNAAASFRDWNPTRFIETAEMTHAFALGYDWLFNSLSPEERAWMRDALLAKGIEPALPYYQKQTWWTRERFNWNVVCNSAIAMAVLAISEPTADEPARDKMTGVFRDVLESIPHGLTSFGADGGWPEGPFFGETAMRYAALFFGSVESALGSDYGLSGLRGVDRAGRYKVYTTGPTSRSFNFADGPEDPTPAPEMLWMAKRYNNQVYAWNEERQIEKGVRPDPLDLAWFDRDAKPPQLPAWPLDTVFHGVSVAVFRSVWDDPNAIFLAIKGGDNRANHTHLDLGTFVLEAGGVRWASDMGIDDAPGPGGQRNGLYRTRTEAHNTLLIDGENQDAKAEARVTRQDSTGDLSWVQIDLSKANPRVKQWIRRAGIAQRQAVMIQDMLQSDVPVEVIWNMVTEAEITINGPTATLRKNGWNLTAEIRSPRHAVFDIAPARPNGQSAPNPKFQKLIVRLLEKVTELDLNIVLTPWRDGQSRPKVTAQFPSV